MTRMCRCTIIGTVSHYLLDHYKRPQYDKEVSDLRRQLSRFNRAVTPTASTTYGMIKAQDEFRFTLLRHWNIHDSMLHSRYIATKLQMWRDRGRQRLSELFASMGIPLEACKKDWFVMERVHRDDFSASLLRYSKRFGLEEVSFGSFIRDYGYEWAAMVSAGDVVHAIMALMESPGDHEDRLEMMRSNFSTALQALDMYVLVNIIAHYRKGMNILKLGISKAITQHQVIFKQINSIFTHRILRYGKRFRYAVMRGSMETSWFLHPTSLLRLALFLKDAQATSKKAHLPLLVAAHQPSTDTFLVVGVSGSSHNLKAFGSAYREAVDLCKARVRHDSFDATVIEVAGDDLKAFIQTLQNV